MLTIITFAMLAIGLIYAVWEIHRVHRLVVRFDKVVTSLEGTER